MASKPEGAIKIYEQTTLSSLLIFSTGWCVARKRRQNDDASRYFASREELCSELGAVEKRHDGDFQQAVGACRILKAAGGIDQPDVAIAGVRSTPNRVDQTKKTLSVVPKTVAEIARFQTMQRQTAELLRVQLRTCRQIWNY